MNLAQAKLGMVIVDLQNDFLAPDGAYARGNTASSNVQKPARIDNGYEFSVPLFINEGDVVRIDTRTGEYSDRVSKK